jgi:predicted extracellular nuclease
MMRPKPVFFLLFIISFWAVSAQNTFRVMFYNVENLFDILDEPGKEDDEFTPEGFRHWTNYRYYNKLNNLAKVITSVGEWETPALVGMCEVENPKVIEDLIRYSPLRKMQYRYIITESEDARGIDVALLYQRDRFKYLYHSGIRISFPGNPHKKTRDILHVTGEVITGDTLDVFVCHFPSRRGGQYESEPDRMYVASVLREKADSVMALRREAHILIMGDFNDEPSDKSISRTLNAQPVIEPIAKDGLYNLFLPIARKSPIGSFKFGNQWNFLDQMIVSGSLLNPTWPFQVLPETARIFQAEFILTDDITHGGKRPKKTFHGYRYEGGYSDHLPIVADFRMELKK